MPLFQTYPLKNSYSGNDILVITDTDIDPNTSKPIDETKSLRLSTLINAASGGLTLTTTGTSGAATFNTNTKVLNIPIYAADTNTTYDLNVPTAGTLRLTGSDGTTDNVTFSGTGGISITALAANNIAIDGSGISGGVTQVTAASPAASTGAPLVVNPTTGNVTVQSKAYAGGSNIGHVPAGGSSNTFLRGDGNFSTVVTATPAFTPLTHMMATTSVAISTAACYKVKALSTVKMSPTKIKLFFPSAAGENISIAVYTSPASSTVMIDATLYASLINQNVGSSAGEQSFTLTQESGVGDIEVGDGIVFVLSIKGQGAGDTILGGTGVSDAGLAVLSSSQAYQSSSFPANVSGLATGFSATSRRISYFLF